MKKYKLFSFGIDSVRKAKSRNTKSRRNRTIRFCNYRRRFSGGRRCSRGFSGGIIQRSPCSTFKIISSLVALENGIIKPENSTRIFNGFADSADKRIFFCVYLGETADQGVSSVKAKEIAVKIVSDYL